MSAPANRWKLGLFVLSGFGLVAAGFTWLGVRQLQRPTHVAWAYFDEALTGLEEGSPVRFRGVRIGGVARIDIAPDKKHLAVQLSLYDDYLPQLGLSLDQVVEGEALHTNLRAQVVQSWVTGTAFVQVDFFPDPETGPQQLPFAGLPNTLRTVPSTAKSLEVAGREVLRELPAMAAAGRELLAQLRGDLQAAHVPELAARVDRLLVAAEQEVGELHRLGTVASWSAAGESVRGTADSLRSETGALVTALREVQALAKDLRAAAASGDVGATAASVRGAADRAAGAAGALGAFAGELQGELAHLRSALDAVQRLATMLEQDPGALLHGRGAPPQSPLQEPRK